MWSSSESRSDHGADSGLREQLEQQRVLCSPVDDVRERYAVQRAKARLELGNHATGDLALLDALARVLLRQYRDHLTVDALDPGHVGDKDHLRRLEPDCDLRGDRAGR